MSMRRRCPVCSFPYPMHSSVCISLQEQLERIPNTVDQQSDPAKGKMAPVQKPLLIELHEGVDDE